MSSTVKYIYISKIYLMKCKEIFLKQNDKNQNGEFYKIILNHSRK